MTLQGGRLTTLAFFLAGGAPTALGPGRPETQAFTVSLARFGIGAAASERTKAWRTTGATLKQEHWQRVRAEEARRMPTRELAQEGGF